MSGLGESEIGSCEDQRSARLTPFGAGSPASTVAAARCLQGGGRTADNPLAGRAAASTQPREGARPEGSEPGGAGTSASEDGQRRSRHPEPSAGVTAAFVPRAEWASGRSAGGGAGLSLQRRSRRPAGAPRAGPWLCTSRLAAPPLPLQGYLIRTFFFSKCFLV